MVESAEKASGSDADEQKKERAPAQAPGAHAHEPAACPVAWCPICLAVSTVQPIKPDVIEHLLKAGTELLLAMRAVVDARADEVDGAKGSAPPVRLEKIDIG